MWDYYPHKYSPVYYTEGNTNSIQGNKCFRYGCYKNIYYQLHDHLYRNGHVLTVYVTSRRLLYRVFDGYW